MGFLRDKIKANLESHASAKFDYARCEELKEFLGTFSVKSEVSVPGSPGHIHQSMLNQESLDLAIVGSLRVRDRSFDYIELWETHSPPEEGETPDSLDGRGHHVLRYWYVYIVPVQIGENRKYFYAGMYRPDDDKWISDWQHTMHRFKNGELSIADKLNFDPSLMQMILEDNTRKQTYQIWPSKKDNYAMYLHLVFGPKSNPTFNDIEIAERISAHIKTSSVESMKK